MLQETEHRIENLPKPLYDIDVSEQDLWIGVTEFSDNNQCVILEENRLILPEKVRFPCVRFINEQLFLVVNTRTNPNQKNAWIFDFSGELKLNFYVGDAIQDVIISKEFIAVTYFDESGGEGINIYNFSGERLFNYREFFSSEAVDIFDCYAACFVKDNKIAFFSYTEFPLVLLDIETKTQEVWQTPAEVAGSDAITKMGNKIYFHSPYQDEFGIYEWKIGSEKAQRIESYSSYLRGLPRGNFLAKGNSGYTIISLQ